MRSSRALAAASRVLARAAQDFHGRQGDIFQNAHMGEEIEGLEHDADFAPQFVHVDARPRHSVALKHDLAAVNGLQSIDAAKQGGLAAARRTDEADDLVLLDLEIDPAQHGKRTEALLDFSEFEE